MLRLLTAISCVLVLGACDGKPTSGKPSTLAPADQTYTVRGTIERLPGPGASLMVHHQPIPEFVGRDGKVAGMREMSMEFAHIAPNVALESWKVGDDVLMTFEVRWKSEPRSLVTALAPAPPKPETTAEQK